MENKKTKRKGPGTLDVFIILAVVVVLAGIGLRAYMTRNADVGTAVVLEDYIVSFEVLNIRDSSNARHMQVGDKFYLKDNDIMFGTLQEGNIVNDAAYFYEMPDGTIKKVLNNASGDHYKVDVEADVLAQGTVDQNGAFLLGGNTYLALNKEIPIYSKSLAITVKITGIRKAS